jgi:hypothetical protein
MQQDTAWFARQLFDTQIVGEFKLADGFSLDVRGTYANSKRKAPGELFFEYARTNAAADPYGAFFINVLNNGNRGNAEISFSDLNENLWAGSADLSWLACTGYSAKAPPISSSVAMRCLTSAPFEGRRDSRPPARLLRQTGGQPPRCR